MEKLRKILFSNRKKLLNKDNVVGVGIGKKMVRGKKTDEDSIVVFVKKKIDRNKISAKNLVPSQIKGVKTDVIEIGEVKALPATDRVRPAYPGVSIGHYAITAGTLGAIVRSKKSGETLILSNNHVLANISNGKDGRAKPGDIILQPGPADGGSKENDIIAYLNHFVPLRTNVEEPECNVASTATVVANSLIRIVRSNYRMKLERATASANRVDAAVAKPINSRIVKSEIPEIGRVKGVADAQIGDNVKKMGRTSGLTTGTIDALDVTIMVNMSEGVQAVFEEQIVSDIKSLPGDSGSLVVNENNEAVGLLFAGSSSRTVINSIKHVMEELQIEF
ncbi:MAG: hypothetical protein PWQ96_1499 [Clostridia bacterium]|nr:hypothetical protein [Clostridia bacterium]